MTNLDGVSKNRDITLPTKVHIVNDMVFPVVTYECMRWTIKKAKHQRINLLSNLVLEKTWKSGIKPVNPKGNQSWIVIGRTDAEHEAAILWPPDGKSRLIGKDPDAGKDWRQEKGATEDEMTGWHHQLDGHEFEQAPEDGEGRGSLACCSPWGHKESNTTEQQLLWVKCYCTLQRSHSWKEELIDAENFTAVSFQETITAMPNFTATTLISQQPPISRQGFPPAKDSDDGYHFLTKVFF